MTRDSLGGNRSDAVTDDAFLGGRLRILQPARNGYRAGLDAVLAAAAVPCRNAPGCKVLDAGAGVGTLGLCVAANNPAVHVTLVENDPLLLELAAENIARNGLTDRVVVVAADIAAGGVAVGGSGQPDGDAASLPIPAGAFDHVVANPPYFDKAAATSPSHERKANAHAMDAADLLAWTKFLVAACKPRGRLTLIHRTEVLPALLAALDRRFGDLQIFPVQSRPNLAAGRILLRGTKGSRAPLSLRPAIVMHDTSGNTYRPDIDAVLRGSASLDLAD